MDMTISVPDEVVEKLKERAAVNGQSIPIYTAQLVTESVAKPTIDELLAPVRADFAKTGMSEDELVNLGREALAALRQELGISQRELARRIGKPPSFVNKIELFERRLDVIEFIVIAEALGRKPDQLMRALRTSASDKSTTIASSPT